MAWNFREVDQRDEIAHLKETLSVQETKYASLEDQYLGQNNELAELKKSFEEALQKLHSEADRALRLESDLARRTDDLQKERFARGNAEAALITTRDQIKAEAATSKELQAIVDKLSNSENGSRAEQSKLIEENSKLQSRVRQLESEVRRLAFVPPVSAIPKPSARPRTSSLTNLRVTTLERDLAQLRISSEKSESELQVTKAKLTKAQDEVIRAENENVALKKRMESKIRDIQSSLEEREEELAFLRSQGDFAAREQELLERLEMEESRIVELEAELCSARKAGDSQRALAKVRQDLSNEANRRIEGEAREIELAKEREDALDELERVRNDAQDLSNALRQRITDHAELEAHLRDLQKQLATSSNVTNILESQLREARASPPEIGYQIDEKTVTRLLSAVERLRAERDNLRRDLEFTQMESRFALEAHKVKMALADDNIATLEAARSQIESSSQPVDVTCWEKEALRLRRMTCGLAATVNYFYAGYEELSIDVSGNQAVINSSVENTARITAEFEVALANTRQRLADVESDLADKVLELKDWQQRYSGLEVLSEEHRVESEQRKDVIARMDEQSSEQVSNRESEIAELKERLAKMTQTLEDAERLRLEFKERIVSTQDELANAQRDLQDSEERCKALQTAHLSSMSSPDAAKAMKDQLATLEERVGRRNATIGDLHHVIKRLETNLSLAEERLEELSADIEMANTEKAAMLEDCTTARDERDDAHKMIQTLEVEVDTLNQQLVDETSKFDALNCRFDVLQQDLDEEGAARAAECATLVSLVVEKTGRSAILADLCRSVHKVASLGRTQLAELKEGVRAAESAKGEMADECERLSRAMAETQDERTLALETIRRELAQASAEIQQLAANLDRAQTSLKSSSDSLRDSETQTAQLTDRIAVLEADIKTKVEEAMLLQSELDAAKAAQQEGASQLHNNLSAAKQELESQLQISLSTIDDLQTKQQQTKDALDLANEELARHRSASDALRFELERVGSAHAKETEDLKEQVESAATESLKLRQSVESEKNGRRFDQEAHRQELANALEKCKQAAKHETKLGQDLQACQEQLQDARLIARTLQEEKIVLQTQIETLETETQGAVVKYQAFEKQVYTCECEIVSLKDELSQVGEQLVIAEKAAKAAETKLAFFSTQHENTAASHRKAIQTVTELKEQNEELERVLRSKCVEIEENDDKFIQLLKEKKKLSSKVDALTRKVQSLQNKVTSASPAPETNRATSAVSGATDDVLPPVPPIPQPSSSKATSTAGATPMPLAPLLRPKTPELKEASSKAPRVAPIERPKTPTFPRIFSPSVLAPSSRQNTPEFSQLRPKTPESSRGQAVFKLKTPERVRALSTPSASDLPTTFSGKKRPAPDDFYPSEPLPAQPVMPDIASPHVRRPSQTMRSGFTPVRHQTSSGSLSPMDQQQAAHRRLTTTTLTRGPIADVTNGGRRVVSTHPKAQGRGWLGKLRGGSSESKAARSHVAQDFVTQ
ncbi:hypothetical protein BD410DRAFT_783402 [Rickenella mellea]|uniref:Uncharacterized protein n=1 Tax=Rickenella mellea TaxID=50990 RepID=A0A4Y7QG19_9AGAM|nr:hypothetical protein BD410DRAFT_783402 [Rickenella mellea]